jgi:hypothetical protein
MEVRFRVTRARIGAVVGALALVATGVALGVTSNAYTDAEGVYHGCVAPDGVLRVVASGQSCKKNETAIDWNQVGPQGPQGIPGTPGLEGPKGDKGDTGAQGTPGIEGEKGDTGATGPTGERGPQGIQGERGPAGADGDDGADGEQGIQGLRGPQGEPGPAGSPGGLDCADELRIKAAAPTFVLSTECVPSPGEGDVCDDGDDGTYDDRIRGGVCAGLPIPDCDDGDPSTQDVFDAATGSCTHIPIDPPTPETCNAIDDDHDGQVDEGLGFNVPNGFFACVGGAESLFCNSGFANGDGDVENGCEVNLMTDPANCGALGNVVHLPNATGACVGGQPRIAACQSGWGDANHNHADGCETNLMTDPANCGAVGQAVNIPHATGACAGGVAVLVSCDAGWFNANGSLVDGCEFHEDVYEPNDSSGAARLLSWGSTISANFAPQGDEDWFRYNASCFFVCSLRFTFSGSGTMDVYEDGNLVDSGSVVTLSRTSDHFYTVRILGAYGSSYTLQATGG